MFIFVLFNTWLNQYVFHANSISKFNLISCIIISSLIYMLYKTLTQMNDKKEE